MKRIFILIAVLNLLQIGFGFAQNFNRVKKPEMHREDGRKEMRLPKLDGVEILKCDFHIHTMFSDGDVWPTVRVQEAWREGLDAIAITDHIEYLPHKKYLNADFNASYEIAKPEAERLNIMLVRGAEITRGMPPGHLNALFLSDVNPLEKPDFMDVMAEANKQGAFVVWNHPGWSAQQPDTTRWWPIHNELYDKGWLHGIEVFGWDDYCPVATQWCREKNLAFIGATDVHDPVSSRFDLERHARPMTLVFAADRSMEGLKKAMFERRTVALFGDEVAGTETLLRQLFEASVVVKPSFRTEKDKVYFEISNPTDLTFRLENKEPQHGAPQKIELLPGHTVIVSCDGGNGTMELPYEVTNLHVGMKENLSVKIGVPVK